MRADQLVGVRVVRDDVGGGGYRHRFERIWGDSNRAWQLHGTVLVRVFQADVENRRPLAAIQSFFQLFLGDALDGHGAILAVGVTAVKLRRAEPLARPGAGSVFGSLTLVDRPAIRPLSAMDAAEEDRAGRAGHPVVMPSREVAVQPIPHKASEYRACNLS